MDINHPLYPVLKDYYTNSTGVTNGDLLIQYIEDTCDIDNDKYRIFLNLKNSKSISNWYFCNKQIFVENKSNYYCYFTNRKINIENTDSDLLSNSQFILGKYIIHSYQYTLICLINLKKSHIILF